MYYMISYLLFCCSYLLSDGDVAMVSDGDVAMVLYVSTLPWIPACF